ncbi:MAG TPA: hypothetical protein VK072_00750 [Candidatus Avamphibacillus sp.]|nr:hypothetical protein [Candidatus Avamphibacillus sp.]
MKRCIILLSIPGYWKLGLSYAKEGMEEIVRSMSKRKFVANLQKLIPDITEDDLFTVPAGVCAQALQKDGTLYDDFFIVNGKNSIHICNAPSPAATASLEIGKEITKRIKKERCSQILYRFCSVWMVRFRSRVPLIRISCSNVT